MQQKRQIHEFLAMKKHEWSMEDLGHALQSAMALEHSTLPLYTFAMHSIRTQNYTAYNLIRSIIMEEMIHMAVTANMLTAIGGVPQIKTLHPAYPTQGLPGGAEPDVHARLAPLSKKQVRNFMRVEVPDHLLPNFLTPEQMANEQYPTIGGFYNAIREALVHLETEGNQVSNAIGEGGEANQVEDDIGIAIIEDFNGMLAGIDEITEQGEGAANPTLLASSDYEGEESHYAKFAEIFYGSRFVNPELRYVNPETEKSFFRGDVVMMPDTINVLAVTADGYQKILREYKARDPESTEHISQALDGVDHAYTDVMTNLDAAWNGPIEKQGPSLSAAVIGMTELKVPVRIDPAIMSQQIPEEIISNLFSLYPDEYDDLREYTDLAKPVFFGPRFINLNVAQLPTL